MGFLSKLWKGVKKTVKKIGKGIKSAVGKVGKFMDKIGIVGQIGLSLVLPGVGAMLGQWAGVASTGFGSGFINAFKTVVNAGIEIGTKASSMFSTVTEGVTNVLGEVAGATLNEMGLGDTVKNLGWDISSKSFTSVGNVASQAWDATTASVGDLFSKSTLTATNKYALQAAAEESLASGASEFSKFTVDPATAMPKEEIIKLAAEEGLGDISKGAISATANATTQAPMSLLDRGITAIKDLPKNLAEKGIEFIEEAPEKAFNYASEGLKEGISGAAEAGVYKAAGIDTQPIYNQSSYATYVPTIAGPDESVGYGAQLQFSSAPSAQRMLQNPYGYSASEFNNNAYKNRMASYGYNV